MPRGTSGGKQLSIKLASRIRNFTMLKSKLTSRAAMAILAGIAVGIPTGIGLYTFGYAKGYSYMTNDPKACANCHIMQDHYSAWLKSSHKSVATCNDCHTPPGLIPKYFTKASNGFWHSYGFTTGDFHEPIRIKASNMNVTEQACRKCHAEIVEAIEGPGVTAAGTAHKEMGKTSCIKCHSTVGHME